MKKTSVGNNIKKYYVVIGSLCILAVIILLILSISENTKQQLVQIGTLEHAELNTGYVIKNEVSISKEQGKVLVPIVAEGARIAKNDIIATYKGDEYKDYEQTLSQMDKKILEYMQDLPVVYSSEIDAIENTVYQLLKKSVGENSYNKMQDYKQKINSNIAKRASIIGKLSPTGAEIKRLIEERNEYEAKAKQSNDNILAPIPGIVSYAVDGLEEKLRTTDISQLKYDDVKEMVAANKKTDNTRIKVVNNYEAYVIIQSDENNLQYMREGYNYRLRLAEQDNYEVTANLEKSNKTDKGVEVYFKLTNGIENLVNLREIEVEVVWDSYQGLIVPREYLNKYEYKDIYYVTVIRKSGYQDIPVKLELTNETLVAVTDYTQEELQELGIESEYKLKLHDRIILKAK